jgi:hypothetical protein
MSKIRTPSHGLKNHAEILDTTVQLHANTDSLYHESVIVLDDRPRGAVRARWALGSKGPTLVVCC